jgi:nucleoside phosphorylase/tetratricopeptide (TPR) repeat protein
MNFKHQDYTVGWICALPIEMAVAVGMLDERHGGLPQDSRDHNSYTLGRIGPHNVAIACLPAGVTGVTSAVKVASQMLSTFTRLRFGLMVGIGGGVPSEENDIRLGDVVVSKPVGTVGGVIQYDFGKTVQEGRFERTGSLNRPSDMLLRAVASLQAKHLVEELNLTGHLSDMASRYPQLRAAGTFPGIKHDQLFQADYNHTTGETTCMNCDTHRLVIRPYRNDNSPAIHYGLIASGNQVMRDGQMRERLRREMNVLCFEMEAAGLMDEFPCLAVRGICDYADTHKNKRWQPYAAAVAAAYAKELLNIMSGSQVVLTKTVSEVATTEGDVSTTIKSPKYFIYPSHKLNHFVERRHHLQSLEKCFQDRKKATSANLAVLLGMGGCGKSHLALAFCQLAEQSDECGYILWVDATSPSSASQSFTTIAQEIVEHEFDITDEAENVRLVLIRLAAAGKPWLLVFDNFDDPSSFADKPIYEYFPRQRYNGFIIITSRHTSTRNLGFTIDMTAMTGEEALELLLQRCQTERTQHNISAGQQIVKRLGYHALAIDQAGAYISDGASLDLYMTRYEKYRERLMNEVPAFTTYKRKLESDSEKETALTVFTTWELSLDLIRGDEVAKYDKRYFLTLAAFFNGTDVSAELFQSYHSQHNDWMSSCSVDGHWDELKFEETLKQLRDLSLLQNLKITSSGIQFSVHPLIQDWAKLRIDTESRRAFTVDAVMILGDFLSGQDSNKMTLDTKQSTLSHLDATRQDCREYLVHEDYCKGASFTDSIAKIATFYYDQGRYNAAEEMNHRALKGRKLLLGQKNPDTLVIMNNLAQALSKQGNYAEAERIHRQTLALREKVLSPEHPDTLVSMSNLAKTLKDQGKDVKAERMHRQTLALKEKVLGPEHRSTLVNMNEVGMALSSQGKYTEAERMHRQTLALREKISGPEHLETLTCMSNLAKTLRRQDKYAEAERMHRQTLVLKEKVLGPEHPSTLVSMNEVGIALKDQGKYTEAERMHRQTLALREKVSGPEHPETLTCMSNLAKTLSRQEKHAEAERMHRQTLALKEKVLGLEHPSTLISINEVGLTLSNQGKYTEAERMYRQTLALREKVSGLEHPETLTCMNNLALALEGQGEYAEAEKIHRQTLALKEKVLGLEHPSTIRSKTNLAIVLRKSGQVRRGRRNSSTAH